MSRYHPQNYPHNDILSNCESYMSKLIMKKPIEKPKLKPHVRPATQMQLNRMPVTKNSIVPFTKSTKLVDMNDDELIHKEVINNKMAQVEVTVRTVSTRSRSSNSTGKREPWAKLLNTNQEGENKKNIDYALSTIHYLSKELERKLQTTSIDDPNINQLIHDIQNTLYRLGPEVNYMRTNQDNLPYNGEAGENFINRPEQIVIKNDQNTQTELDDSERGVNYDEYLRIQNKCQQIESVYQKFNVEKEEIEKQLVLERELVEKLKKEMTEKFNEKNEKTLKVIKELREERDKLEEEIIAMKNQETENNQSTVKELNNTIEKLKSDNSLIEYDNLKLKYELTVMKLEKEKLAFLLDSRDKQLKSLKNEMESIQSIVCSQLLDLKPEYIQSVLSKTSLDSWKPIHQFKMHKKEQPLHELYSNRTSVNNIQPQDSESIINAGILRKIDTVSTFKSKMDYHDEYPQRDVPVQKTDTKKYNEVNHVVLSDMTLNSENPESVKEDLETNIKDMFEELKRQALVVTMKSPSTNNNKELNIENQFL